METYQGWCHPLEVLARSCSALHLKGREQLPLTWELGPTREDTAAGLDLSRREQEEECTAPSSCFSPKSDHVPQLLNPTEATGQNDVVHTPLASQNIQYARDRWGINQRSRWNIVQHWRCSWSVCLVENQVTWVKYLLGIPGTGRWLVRGWLSTIRHQTFCLNKLSLRVDLELASSSNYCQPDCIYVLTLVLLGWLWYMNALICYRGLVLFMCKSAASEPKVYVPHKKGLLLPATLPELQPSDGFLNHLKKPYHPLSDAYYTEVCLHGET